MKSTVEGSMVAERFDDGEKDKKKKRRSNRRNKQNPSSSSGTRAFSILLWIIMITLFIVIVELGYFFYL
jgi:hypothetical protein